MGIEPVEITENEEALEVAESGKPVLVALEHGTADTHGYGIMILPSDGEPLSLHQWAHLVKAVEGTIAIYLGLDPDRIGEMFRAELEKCQSSSSAASSSH